MLLNQCSTNLTFSSTTMHTNECSTSTHLSFRMPPHTYVSTTMQCESVQCLALKAMHCTYFLKGTRGLHQLNHRSALHSFCTSLFLHKKTEESSKCSKVGLWRHTNVRLSGRNGYCFEALGKFLGCFLFRETRDDHTLIPSLPVDGRCHAVIGCELKGVDHTEDLGQENKSQ